MEILPHRKTTSTLWISRLAWLSSLHTKVLLLDDIKSQFPAESDSKLCPAQGLVVLSCCHRCRPSLQTITANRHCRPSGRPGSIMKWGEPYYFDGVFCRYLEKKRKKLAPLTAPQARRQSRSLFRKKKVVIETGQAGHSTTLLLRSYE